MIDVSNVKLLEDWILVKKIKEFESEEKVGSIIIPKSIITTVRESKVGLIVAKGKGRYNKKRVFRPTSVMVGSLVYCTRFEKTKFEAESFGAVGDYMLMREADIQAYIILGSTRTIMPLFDKIWIEEIEEVSDSEIIKVSKDDIRRWYVRAVGDGYIHYENTDTPLSVKSGDIIHASKDTGVQVSWVIGNELKKFRIISERDVLVIEDNN